MSLPITPSIPPRLRLTEAATDTTTQATPNQGTALGAGGAITSAPPTDMATLSDGAAYQIGRTLAAKGPPFDLETVARIKEAIAEGRYPIDTKAISESLFAGFSDMNL